MSSEGNEEMYVLKRNGDLEIISFDKILKRKVFYSIAIINFGYDNSGVSILQHLLLILVIC